MIFKIIGNWINLNIFTRYLLKMAEKYGDDEIKIRTAKREDMLAVSEMIQVLHVF